MTADGQIPGQLHIPTAAHEPVSMTRQQVTDALAADETTRDRIDCWADRCFTEPAVHLQADTQGKAL